MRRIYSILSFLIVLIFLISCSPKANNPLEGFWYDSYPMNDSSGGFLFLKNGDLYYFHLSDQNIERRYIGSFGEWRINSNEIEIKLIKHFFLKNPVILQNAPAARYAIGSDNYIKYLSIAKSSWQKIGNIQQITVAHFPSMVIQKNTVDNGIDLPCIKLPMINNAEISEQTLYYQTETLSNLSSEVSGTVLQLKNAKKGTEGEWRPGNPVQVIQSSVDSSTD